MKEGEIKIEPFIPEIQTDRKRNRIWLRTDDEYKVFRQLREFKEPIGVKNVRKYTESKKVGGDEKIVIPSREAILWRSLEQVFLSDKVIARIEPKQVMGLLATGFTIGPKFEGHIEVLVWNYSPLPIAINAGEEFVSLMVYQKD